MQGVSAFGQRLPDTDQQTGGERNRQPSCVGERAKPHLGILVRAAVVGKAPCFKQSPRCRLQHHAHRRRNRFEPGKLSPTHHARVQVRQQTGLFEHPDRHRSHVVQGRVVAPFVKPLPCLRPPRLRSVTEGEQRLLASESGTAAGDVNDLIRLEVHAATGGPQLAGHRDEGAVVAGVSTQVSDRDEYFARVRHR